MKMIFVFIILLFLLLSDNDLFGACSLVCRYDEDICSGLEVRQVYIQDVVVCICFKDLAVHCGAFFVLALFRFDEQFILSYLCRQNGRQ